MTLLLNFRQGTKEDLISIFGSMCSLGKNKVKINKNKLPSAHVMREKYKNKFQNVDIGCEKC
jgi:hypothetical protein